MEMVRIIESHDVDQRTRYYSYAGLSTDTKPTVGDTLWDVVDGQKVTYTLTIATGSSFLEVDTSNVFFFDEISYGGKWWQAGGSLVPPPVHDEDEFA